MALPFAPASEPDAAGATRRVLLVEDSRPYAELVEALLEDADPDLVVAHCSGIAEAAAALAERDHDCVLMDLNLPDASGLAGMQVLLECSPATPVVVLTGQDDGEVGLQAVKEGAQDFLVKSRSDGQLIARAVRHAIERKQVETDLAERVAHVQAVADRQRDFVASASHELRTPLTSILGYLEMVLEEPDADPAEQRAHVEVAYRNSRRLLDLVEDLLTVHQVDGGSLSLEPEPVALDELLDAATEVGRGLCARAGHRLQVERCPRPVRLLVDRARTVEVLDNLIGNAVKFTPSGGHIRLSAALEGGTVAIRVADDGVGIAPEDLPSVFDRFFRSPASVRMAVPGTGLGLSIAKALLVAQGGDITVSSRLGAGTTFTVVLPVSSEIPWPAS